MYTTNRKCTEMENTVYNHIKNRKMAGDKPNKKLARHVPRKL